MPHQVFLSYSTKDTAATEAVCQFLEAKGVRCWMAPRDIAVGHDWAEAIIGALNRCPVMVLIYSSHANASSQVTREVQRAFEKGLTVFPFRIELVEPSPGLEYYLGSVHWLDALTPPLDSHMGKLATAVEEALKRHVNGEQAENPAPLRRREPQPLAQSSPSSPGRKKGVLIATAALGGTLALGGMAWWSGYLNQPPRSPQHAQNPPQTPALPKVEVTPSGDSPAVEGEPLASAGEVLPTTVVDEAPAETAAAEPPPVEQVAPEKPEPPPAAATPAESTQELPWRDGFSTAYLPIPGTDVLFALWPTRVQDYEVFAQATQTEWPKTEFEQEANHPAVNITWNNAQAYCDWFTQYEREAGRLPAGYHYRLPTEAEWNRAAGFNEAAQGGGKTFPWGEQWPPPSGAGNYATSLETDTFPHTSPVGSFAANRFGLFDMGGNVWQWCADEPGQDYRIARGASWMSSTPRELSFDPPPQLAAVYQNHCYGFRCVLAPLP